MRFNPENTMNSKNQLKKKNSPRKTKEKALYKEDIQRFSKHMKTGSTSSVR